MYFGRKDSELKMKVMNDSTKSKPVSRWAACAVLSWACLSVKSGWAEVGATGRAFNVREDGAKGDGKTLDTTAIQKALDDCGNAGGGVVEFPGGTYLSKPITVRTKTTVQLDAGAVLKATDDRADFEIPGKPNSFLPFIGGKNLQDVTITGQGLIDGSGAKWWGPAEDARRKQPGYTLPRPNLIVLTGCKNLHVENITIQNSPKFHLVPMDCDGVIISNVTITAPESAANTDAIDPSTCRNVLITKCRIDVGDDNVAIKSGHKIEGREFATENIMVTDCTFLHGHGMSIGSETAGGVRNVMVRNCTFEGTENGIRIKSQRGKGGVVENISYSDIVMKNVDPAITLTCYYTYNSAGDAVQKSAPKEDAARAVDDKTPVYRNIRISNLQATTKRAAGVILGLPESAISNVVLENVQITAATTGLSVKNAKAIQFKNVQLTNKEGPPLVTENAEVDGWKDPAQK
jgi:polygalacturonase